MRILRWLFYLLLLCFIFGNVYVATLPKFQIYEHTSTTNGNTAAQIKQQIICFQNWKHIKGEVKISPKLATNPLDSELEVELNHPLKGFDFSVHNYYVSDTLVVQHLYGLSGVEASVMQWRISNKEVALRLQENFSTLHNCKKVLGYTNIKTAFLQQHYKSLLQWQTAYVLPKQKPNADSLMVKKGVVVPQKNKITPPNIIRLPKQ